MATTRKPRTSKTRRPSPYDRAQATSIDAAAPTTAMNSAQLSALLSTAAIEAPATKRETLREAFLEIGRKRCPRVTARNDAEIVLLATRGDFKDGDDAAFAKFADEQLDLALALVYKNVSREEGIAKYTARMKEVCDQPAVISGRKPKPGEEDVRIRPIPESDYSIRLWGKGLESAREYCFDFVLTATGQPVNSPFPFKLVGLSNPEAPWLPPGSTTLISIDRVFQMRQEDIPPGEEKFVVMEGTICQLKRPGKQDVVFKIPIRPRVHVPVVPEYMAKSRIIEF